MGRMARMGGMGEATHRTRRAGTSGRRGWMERDEEFSWWIEVRVFSREGFIPSTGAAVKGRRGKPSSTKKRRDYDYDYDHYYERTGRRVDAALAMRGDRFIEPTLHQEEGRGVFSLHSHGRST